MTKGLNSNSIWCED